MSLMGSWGLKPFSCDSEDTDQTADAQADLNLHWSKGHFIGFVLSISPVSVLEYLKIPKNSDTRKIAVINLQVEQGGYLP